MRSHAKASTAGSTRRRAKGLGRNRSAQTAVLAVAIAALLALAATPASASLQRNHEGSFGSFAGESPQALTVDQSNGDLYVLDAHSAKVLRYDSSGLPHDFSAGPGAGTNELAGLGVEDFASISELAVDDSGGPSDGNLYVTERGSARVKVFAQSGEPLGTLTGTATPNSGFGEICGVAVDQANGDLYVADFGGFVWRYSPSGATVAEGDYSGGIQAPGESCQLAVAQGGLYLHGYQEFTGGAGPLRKFATSAFALGPPPSPSSTTVVSKAFAVATDPSNGDVYVDEGKKVTVLDSAGATKYSFGAGDFGNFSAGVAVKAGGNAYVSDPTAHEVDAYGTTLEPGHRAHLFSFGSFAGESPQALTVDQSNGDLYVLDAHNAKVLRYDSSGLPHNFSAGPGAGTNELTGLGVEDFASISELAVDDSGGPSDGNLYVTERGSARVKVFAQSGEPLGTLTGTATPNSGFGEICGVAVDQANGDLYVADFGGFVWRYSPSGGTVAEGDYSGGIAVPGESCQLAVAQGSLYLHGYQEFTGGAGPLRKFATSAFALGPPPSPSSTTVVSKAFAVATDPSNGDVYVDEGKKVTVLDSAGATKYSFGAGDFGNSSAGVAMQEGGDVYVSDPTSHEVDVYGPFSAPPPIVETKPATGVGHVKATLHGHLDPNNSLEITGCTFEWGTTTSYTEAPVPCIEGGSFNAAADVSAQLSGLTPGTTYHFRLHVTTGSGGFDGEDKSFEAIPASSTPEATTGKGTILSATSSQLKGTIDPNASPLTGCRFEYVTELAFGDSGFSDLSSGGSVPCDQSPGSIPADFEDHDVSATVTGLDPEQVYRFRLVAENAGGAGNGADALVPGPPLVETTGSPYRTTTTARLDSRLSPHGADTDYWFEYVTDAQFQASGFAGAVSTPHRPTVVDEVQVVRIGGIFVGPGEVGGQFRLGFGGFTTPDLTFPARGAEVQAALEALPSIGAGNVHVDFPQGSAASGSYIVTFRGALGNADVEQLSASAGAPPAVETISANTLVPGGTGNRSAFAYIAWPVEGLQPATAYRYRLVADNGTPGGPVFGDATLLTTRASDAPLSHGNLPGPPDSDRAWEQVNVPDTGGNAVSSLSISDNGERAVYGIAGGSPGSAFGGQTFDNSNDQLAERTPNGWVRRDLFPTRAQAFGNIWQGPWGATDLSRLYGLNYDETHVGSNEVWSMAPGAPAERIFDGSYDVFPGGGSRFATASDDGSRMIATLTGPNDPDYPVPPGQEELYDLTSGTPHLIGLLPGNVLPSCGVTAQSMTETGSGGIVPQFFHFLTPDGSHAFFRPACGGLYDRDLTNSTTTSVGFNSLIRSAAGYVFGFGDDGSSGGGIYRYKIDDHSVECITCSIPGGADLYTYSPAVADNGSRVYFESARRLLPGADAPGIYRLDVASGDLAYVAPGAGNTTSAEPSNGNAISADGSVFVFRSDNPALNALNGQQNGGSAQYYRYDDKDRSLVCASCPVDGSVPRNAVGVQIIHFGYPGANGNPLDAAGDFVFPTPTALLAADQNTAPAGQDARSGTDIYEWRDGRLLLVTDGETSSEGGTTPEFAGLSHSGRDLFFSQAAELTPDAIDSTRRLYDARIGGGFEFPTPPPPCSLEACQGTPKGAPVEPPPGSLEFSGSGNQVSPPARCRKGEARRKGRCVAKSHKRKHRANKRHNRRANNDRRAGR